MESPFADPEETSTNRPVTSGSKPSDSGDSSSQSSSEMYSDEDSDFEADSVSAPETMVEIQVYSPPATAHGVHFAEEPTPPHHSEPDEPVEPSLPSEHDEPVEPSQPSEHDEPVEPSQPSERDEPVEPSLPSEHDEPVEPSQPSERDEPVEPSLPSEHDEPVEPSEHDEPVEPSEQSEPEEEHESRRSEVTPIQSLEGTPTASSMPMEEDKPEKHSHTIEMDALEPEARAEEQPTKVETEEQPVEAQELEEDPAAQVEQNSRPYDSDCQHQTTVGLQEDQLMYDEPASATVDSQDAVWNENSTRPCTQAADFNQTIWKSRGDDHEVVEHYPLPCEKSTQAGRFNVSKAKQMLPPLLGAEAAVQGKKKSAAPPQDPDVLPDLHGKSGVNVVDRRTNGADSLSSFSYSSWSSHSISVELDTSKRRSSKLPSLKKRRNKSKCKATKRKKEGDDGTEGEGVSNTPGKKTGKKMKKGEVDGRGEPPNRPQPPKDGKPTENGRNSNGNVNPRTRSKPRKEKRVKTVSAQEMEKESLRLMPNSPYLQPVFPQRQQKDVEEPQGTTPRRPPPKGTGRKEENRFGEVDDPYAYLLGRHGFWGENKYSSEQKA